MCGRREGVAESLWGDLTRELLVCVLVGTGAGFKVLNRTCTAN